MTDTPHPGSYEGGFVPCPGYYSAQTLFEQSYSERRARIALQVDAWRELLGSKIEAPPCGLAGQARWIAGYRAALLDLAKLRADGRRL